MTKHSNTAATLGNYEAAKPRDGSPLHLEKPTLMTEVIGLFLLSSPDWTPNTLKSAVTQAKLPLRLPCQCPPHMQKLHLLWTSLQFRGTKPQSLLLSHLLSLPIGIFQGGRALGSFSTVAWHMWGK